MAANAGNDCSTCWGRRLTVSAGADAGLLGQTRMANAGDLSLELPQSELGGLAESRVNVRFAEHAATDPRLAGASI